MVKYDAQVIVTFADKLYKQAASVVLTFTVLAALIGAGFGAALLGDARLIGALIGAVLVGLLGYKLGQGQVIRAEAASSSGALPGPDRSQHAQDNVRQVPSRTHALSRDAPYLDLDQATTRDERVIG
jgi:hypothetical protein